MKLANALRSYVYGSLLRQFVFAVILVNIALVTMLGLELWNHDRTTLDQHRIARADGMARLLAASAASAIEAEDIGGLTRLSDAAGSIGAVRYVVFEDASGRVLAHTNAPPANLRIADDPAVRASGGDGVVRLTSDNESIEATAPIILGGATIGRAKVSISRADSAGGLAFVAAGYGVAVILLGALIAFLTARSVSERLGKLAAVADQFRLGDHSVRASDGRPDEVGTVTRGLNAMLEVIAASERSLKDVFRIARIASWSYAPSQPTVQWSDSVYELFGLDRTVSPPSADAFLKTLPVQHQRELIRLMNSASPGNTVSFSFSIPHPDGSPRICWAEARLEACSQTGEWALVGICQDITDREAAAAQLRQAQKMEAVGQLTGGVAHDFNNLLAIIIGNLDLMEEELPKEIAARACVEEALAAALRGADLTRQLLAFSRRQPLTPQIIDLNRLVAGMSSLWRRTLGEAIQIRVHLAENLWATRADPTQVESAVLNLVINARDAMPGGGVLTVETAGASVDADGWSEGEADDILPGDYVVITVSDNGSGMSREVASRAFEPFFTTKGVGAGSGLGLSMIYGFAKQSGGSVKIYSEPGHGTTVRLYLPRAQAMQEEGDNDAGPAAAPRASNESVLLVEDNDSVRRISARQLRELGYTVVEASDGPEALALLSNGVKVDVLFTDVVMPGGLDGFQLAKIATDRDPLLKVLHTSGFSQPVIGKDADPLAAGALLSKPYRKIDLATKLREVLDAPPVAVASESALQREFPATDK